MTMDWMKELGWQKTQIKDLRTLAYSYIQQGIYAKALTILEGLLVLAPDTAYDLQTLGALYLQMGDGMRALDTLDRALKYDPTHLKTHLNRAKTLFMLGYRRQGLLQAKELEHVSDPAIASQARALLLAYQSPAAF